MEYWHAYQAIVNVIAWALRQINKGYIPTVLLVKGYGSALKAQQIYPQQIQCTQNYFLQLKIHSQQLMNKQLVQDVQILMHVISILMQPKMMAVLKMTVPVNVVVML